MQNYFGNYQILEQIGSGGTAIIFKAMDTHHQQWVALKLLHEHFNHEPEVMNRFRLEAEIASRLYHPNIVRIIDYGNINGRAYIVQEFMEHGSLQDYFNSPTPITFHDAAHMINQIATGLNYAHSQNIIHRDLKLANILMDSQFNLRLTDFGIARVKNATRLTATGMMPGTPYYMSPEQILGRKDIDHRTDIYSLGVIAYLITTGYLPFTAEEPMVVMGMHMNMQPPPPSTVNSNIPKALNRVILKALEKDPNRRYSNAAEFATEFSRAVHGVTPHQTMVQGEQLNPRVGQYTVSGNQTTFLDSRPAQVGILVFVFMVLLLGGVLGAVLLSNNNQSLQDFSASQTSVALGGVPAEIITATPSPTEEVVIITATPVPTREVVIITATLVPTDLPKPSPTPLGPIIIPTTPPPTAIPQTTSGRAKVLFSSRRVDTNNDGAVTGGDNASVYLLDVASGQVEALTGNDTSEIDPVLSPDGEWIAYTRGDSRETYTVYVTHLPTGQTTFLSKGQEPSWSPDGGSLVFRCDKDGVVGNSDICTMNRDGSNFRYLTNATVNQTNWLPRWSPDNQYIYFLSRRNDTTGDGAVVGCDNSSVMRMSTNGNSEEQITSSSMSISDFNLSPDGQSLVFTRPFEETPSADGRRCLWDDTSELHLLNLKTNSDTLLIGQHRFSRQPNFIDNQRLVYLASDGDATGDNSVTVNDARVIAIFEIGIGQTEKLTDNRYGNYDLSWVYMN